MPKAVRNEPLHLQIAGHYKRLIQTGQIASGDRLPSVREVRDDWEVGHQTAQRALLHLQTEGLVRSGPNGTFANGKRTKYGPQQRMRFAGFPSAERIEILSAGLVSAPAYILPILDPIEAMTGFWPVVRREWVLYEAGGVPYVLWVSWCPAEAAEAAPELLRPEPLPDPGNEARLIAERTGKTITWGHSARESRLIKDDGREGPLLHLPPGSCVLAEVYQWASGDEILEYGEYVVIGNRVIESDMEP